MKIQTGGAWKPQALAAIKAAQQRAADAENFEWREILAVIGIEVYDKTPLQGRELTVDNIEFCWLDPRLYINRYCYNCGLIQCKAFSIKISPTTQAFDVEKMAKLGKLLGNPGFCKLCGDSVTFADRSRKETT